jgi:hypothetical protein
MDFLEYFLRKIAAVEYDTFVRIVTYSNPAARLVFVTPVAARTCLPDR